MQETVQTTCSALVIAAGGPNMPAIRQAMSQRRLAVSLESGAGAREALADGAFDLVVLDLDDLDNAAELVSLAKAHHPERPVIGVASGIAAKEAAIAGCDDVLESPLSADALANLLETLLPDHEVALIDSAQEHRACQIAGRSPAFLRTVELARRVVPTSVPVLITGESGTGKELISHLIHRRSNRGRGPYVRVNCAAVSETLLESELFGHEKGAFTGVVVRKGRFEQAHGGTLLLDEISETGPRLQAELLRVLEQQDFERVGGSDTVRVNVRIISTSNRDLSADVEAGRFRRDLYYRICGVHITAPPLRQRVEDLDALVWHFVNLYSCEVRRRITTLDDGMMAVFAQYPWPGNVRQLRNVVRTAMILGEGPTLSLEHADVLLHELTLGVQAGMARAQQAAAPNPAPNAAPSLSLQDVERKTILEALQRSQKNQAKAARLLGITDRTLREKLRRYRQDGQLEPVEELHMVDNDPIKLIQSSLKVRELRQVVIANNISNAPTPNFRRGDVAFEAALAKALDSGSADAASIEPAIVTPMDTPVNATGNDVDLESEFGALMKNDTAMKTQLRLMGKLYQQMTLAMQVE